MSMDSVSNSDFSAEEANRPAPFEAKSLSMMERMSRLEKAHNADNEQPRPRSPTHARPQYHVGAFSHQTQNFASRHAEDAKTDNGYISDTSSAYSTAADDEVFDMDRAHGSRLLDLTVRPFCFGFSLALGLGVGMSFFDWVVKRP